MNKHGLTKANLVATLPVALQKDPSAVALAEALAEMLSQRPKEIEQLLIYPAIDRLDEQLLDILAYDFKVDWWDAEYSVEEKRQTLKDSWRVHKLLGTKAAVVTAISAIYPHTKVLEWFEYGGEPYHFRLDINITNDSIDSDKQRRVLERLNFYKSLRSHNDAVNYIIEVAIPTETPGHLVFHRFTQNWAFSHFRGGIRFNGDADFGGAIRFDQMPPGIGFPHFTVSTHFANIKGGTPFDGTADFGGGLTFDQAYSSVKFPAMQISTAIGSHRERLTAATSERIKFSNRRGGLRFDGIPLFDGASSFDQDSGGVLFRRFQFLPL